MRGTMSMTTTKTTLTLNKSTFVLLCFIVPLLY